jgi:hypothetical protein
VAAGEQEVSWAERHRDDLIVGAMFAAARFVFIVLLGVRMDTVFLIFAPHIPDLGLLRHHLLQTVWYEHIQPPLFPLGIGTLMKLSPFPDGITFQIVWLAMGLATALVIFRIARMLGLQKATAFVAVGLVLTNPALVSIEFSANYDQPTILLIALIILFVGRWATSGSGRDWAMVCALGATAVLTRTVFHPVWYVLLVAGLALVRWPVWRDRRVILAALLPAVAIGIFVLKNDVLYGEMNLTSWGGPSLTKIAGSAPSKDEIKQLVADGTVSPLFGRDVFIKPYEYYADAVPPCTPKHKGIPILDDPIRPTDPTFDPTGKRTPNLNYECFLPVYRQQGKDAIAFMKARPKEFFGAQATGAQFFFEPALHIVFTRNFSHLHGAEHAWGWTLYPSLKLHPVAHSSWGDFRMFGSHGIDLIPTVVILDLVAIALAVPASLRLYRQRRKTGGGPRRQALAVQAAIGLTCAWVTVIGSAFEINENARYRLLIEPYLLIILAWGGQFAVTWIRRQLDRRSSAPGPAIHPARPA